MKIVISGSTGQIGRQLIERLDFSKQDIVLIGRDASKLQDAKDRGATVATGDLLDGAFLKATLTDADTYFFLPPPNFQSNDMVGDYQRLAEVSRDAARAAGVERIVHLSTLGGHLDREETGLIRGQHIAETIIRDGAPHVLHLRNGFFLENFLGAVSTIAAQGAIYFPVSSESRYSFVTTVDIARIVHDLLDAPTWTGHRVIEFQGPKDYSFGEVAAEFAKALGREVAHVAVPPEAAVEAMVGMGMSQEYAQDLTKLFTSIEADILQAEFQRGDSRVCQNGMTPEEFAQLVLKPAYKKAEASSAKELQINL